MKSPYLLSQSGIKLIAHRLSDATNANLVLKIDGAGSVFDPPGYNGLHHLIEHLLVKSLQQGNSQTEIDINGHTYREYMTIEFSNIPSLQCEKIIDDLGHLFSKENPDLFERNSVRKEVNAMRNERRTHQRNPFEILMEDYDEETLNKPYSTPTSHVDENLEAASQNVLAKTLKNILKKTRLTLIAVGDIPEKKQLALAIDRAFASLPVGKLPTYPLITYIPSHTSMNGFWQESFLYVTLKGFGLNNALRFLHEPICHIFSEYQNTLRDGSSDIYDMFVTSHSWHNVGFINIGIACSPEQTKQTHQKICNLLKDTGKTISEEKWANAQKHIKNKVDHITSDIDELTQFYIHDSGIEKNIPSDVVKPVMQPLALQKNKMVKIFNSFSIAKMSPEQK